MVLKTRSEVVFKSSDIYISNSLSKALSLAVNYTKSRKDVVPSIMTTHHLPKISDCSWKPPITGSRLTVVGHFFKILKLGRIVLCRDHFGNLVEGDVSTDFNSYSALCMEAKAVDLAVNFMVTNQLENVIIESDCSSVVACINKSNYSVWKLIRL